MILKLILLLFTASIAHAGIFNSTFTGRVVTREGKPVEGAHVEAFDTPIGENSMTRKQVTL